MNNFISTIFKMYDALKETGRLKNKTIYEITHNGKNIAYIGYYNGNLFKQNSLGDCCKYLLAQKIKENLKIPYEKALIKADTLPYLSYGLDNFDIVSVDNSL